MSGFLPQSVLWSVSSGAILVCLVAVLLEWLSDVGRMKGRAVLLGVSDKEWFPRIRGHFRYISSGYEMIADAFEEKSDQILQLPLAGYSHYILPHKFVEELRGLPPTIMSSTGGIADYFIGQYTGLQEYAMIGPPTWAAIRNNLTSTRKLGQLVNSLRGSCGGAAFEEFGDSQDFGVVNAHIDRVLLMASDWTKVHLHHALLNIITRMTGPVFVSPKVFSSSRWMQSSIGFATNVMVLSIQLKLFPAFLHSFIFPFFSRWWLIQWHRFNARRALAGEIKKRQQEGRETKLERFNEGKEDMIDWLLDAGGPNAPQPQDVVNRQLGISFAAIHTSSIVLNRILFTLAERWDEYAGPMRSEIELALVDSNGELDINTINKLTKLDSFMKEALRYTPFTAVSFQRKVKQNHTLSDGTLLPAGCQIFMAAGPLAHSAFYYSDPLSFQGFRFEPAPEDCSTNSKAELYTASGVYSMLFGHGRHACPGRFYAALQGKILLAHILQNYELRLLEGKQPETMIFADTKMIDPDSCIEMRKRTPADT